MPHRRLQLVHPLAAAFLCSTLNPAPARAQEPAKIVEQYVKAAGGRQALSKMRTLSLEGAFTNNDGNSGTYTLDTKLPNRYYQELRVGEKNQIEAYNGKSAWRRNAAGELGTLLGPEGMQLEAAAQYYNSRLPPSTNRDYLHGSAGGATLNCNRTATFES